MIAPTPLRDAAPSRPVSPGTWLALLVAASGVAAGALAGCSGPAADEDRTIGDVRPFGGPNGSGTGAPSGGAPAGEVGAAALCITGQARCDGSRRVETCNATGTGFDVTECQGTTVCLAGACRQPTCTAGETVCLGSEIHTCNADGKSTTLARVCGGGQACSPATLGCEPLSCEPLLAACNGNTATRCDATGFAFDFGANSDCGALRCNAGVCRNAEGLPATPIGPDLGGAINPVPAQVAQACTAGQVWCEGNQLNTCNAEGTAMTSLDCGAAGCNANAAAPACQPAQACTPGSVTCDGANLISTCSGDGSGFSLSRCPNGTVCRGAGECAPVSCDPNGMLSHNGDGGVTVYWFAQGTLSVPRGPEQDVNCSFNASRANNDDGGQNDRVAYIQDAALFGAMNFSEYNGAAACGACVQMTQGGRSVTITVADSCNPAINNNGTCTTGHIDLSRNAFQQLTGQSTGDINGITWRYVPCDDVGNVQFLLKKPDDPYWNEFLVVNHRYPIVRAEVLMPGNRWVAAQRQSYNYWRPPEGMDGGDMGTYRVRVTDINGAIIEEQLELRDGLQGGNGQFDCIQ